MKKHSISISWPLLSILLLAAVLRFIWIEQSPPGLQADEASNIWNAWCLRTMGVDEHGENFPVFYTKAFGDNRSALFLYFLMPFQSIGGLSVAWSRVPVALSGVIGVALIAYIGRRLFNRQIGLCAALLYALDPWLLQNSRWAHESTITPMLVLASLALLLKAGAPFGDENQPVRPRLALFAGAFTGLACYGYAAIRLYLPILLLGLLLASWQSWRGLFRTTEGRQFLISLAIGFAATFGPLVFMHLTDPAIMVRGEYTWVWSKTDSLPTRIVKVLARYPGHFDPRFLILNGGTEPSTAPPPGMGQTHWYMYPLLLAGGAWCVMRWRDSKSARVALLAALLYPAGDLLNAQLGPNVLRSLPGVPGLILLGGIVIAWLERLSNRKAILGVAVLIVLASNAYYWKKFYIDLNSDPKIWQTHSVDIKEACDWIRPQMNEIDAVVFTQKDNIFVYAPTLVYLQYDPEKWFDVSQPRETADEPTSGIDVCVRYGKVHMLFKTNPIKEQILKSDGTGTRRAIVVLRPGELDLSQRIKPFKVISRPDGTVTLEMFDVRLP